MKKYVLPMLMIFFSLVVSAQQDGPDSIAPRDPNARQKIRSAHAAYITARLDLTSSEAEKFWPVYREFNEKRRVLRTKLREAKKRNIDGKALLDLDLKIKQQELDLEKQYSKTLIEIISAEQILKLKEAESDFRKLILRQIQHRQRRNGSG
jgi:hypothetical protein